MADLFCRVRIFSLVFMSQSYSFNNLITKKNLLLAWQRVISSRDARYKAFFRHILEAYELSFEANISDLRRRLKNGEYIAHTPVRIYLPKPSGLQRPLTLLSVEDQIVLQAITNLFAEKIRDKRSKLEGKNIFSNKLGGKNSGFFVEKWQEGFMRLRWNIKSQFSKGYNWIATFDISAFYDTIPHELLLRILIPQRKGAFYDLVRKWLKTWSSENPSDEHNHGIPQGPLASDFLAECIMLPIDEKMSQRYSYYRYVDDIRILGKTELEVRQALVYLDILCKSRGLIPNSDKTRIRKIKTADELVEDIPEITTYFEDGGGQSIGKVSAEKLVSKAIERDGSSILIKDRTLLRYSLFRAPASDDILKTVLDLWEHYPEHTDAYVAFLENYQRCDDVISLASGLLNTGYPYDYVQGEFWKLLARMGKKSEISQLRDRAIQTIKDRNSGSASRVGALIFLCKCDEAKMGNYQKWLMHEKKALIQAFITPYINPNTSSGRIACQSILLRTLIDPYLGLVKPLIASSMPIDVFGKNPTTFPLVAQYVYKTAGLLPGHQILKADAIANLISKRYGVKKWNKWKDLFQCEYEHAYVILKMADNSYDSYFNLSSWLGYQDSFNEILFICFQKFLAKKNASGTVVLTHPNGARKNYGGLLNDQSLISAYPDLQDSLLKIHRRRNHLPSSHAYDEKTGDKSQPLKKREQTKIKKYLENAYNEIIKMTENLGI
jgi:retron-type reverse transcriptase